VEILADYRSWRSRFRAICPEPGPQDLFLLVLINGRRAAIQHAADYAQWRGAAERLAESQQCQVKVLPMTGGELMNFLGIHCADLQPIEGIDAAFREQAVRNCLDVLRECGGQQDREDALTLLGQLGALQ
jgi:hypothetical protein